MKSPADLLLAVTSCAVTVWCLADGVDSSNSYIATSRGTFLYPPIGRLFEADIPRNDGRSKSQNKSIDSPRGTNNRVNNRNIGDDFLETVSRHRSESFYDSGEVPRGSQERNSEVDAAKTTVGKSDILKYETRTKGAIRGEVKYKSWKRTKRDSNATAIEEPFDKRRAENQTGDHVTAVNRDRTHKFTFQRKVEELFNNDWNTSSTMTEEEIEKSKLLRKKLLNYYVKSKQKTNTLTPSLNQLKEVVPQETKREEYSPRLVRMSVDIPIDHVDNIEDMFEIYDQDDRSTGPKTDAQGRSRRRRLRRIAIPLLLALKLKVLLFAPIIFGIVSVIALKGLWAGMTALGVVSVLALKSLFNNPMKIMYELRPPPHHYHHPPMAVSEIQYHHDYPEYWNRRDSYKPIGGWR